MENLKNPLDKRIESLYNNIINEMQSYGTKPLQAVGTEKRVTG